MRNEMNPYGGVNPLIDKIIGNSYDIVKYVARYLKEIRYVAENMATVYNAAHGGRTVVEVPSTGASPISVPLPAGVNTMNLQSIDVIATDGNMLYFASPDTFNFGVNALAGTLVISYNSSDPIFVNADWRVTFVFTPAGG